MQTHIFNSQIPVSFREDGFLNATAISAHFGKRPNDYLKTEQTQEYIAALADFLSVTNKIVTKENQVVIIKQGGTEQGTWLHPKLAVHFARWLDAKFAVWCDMKIEEILGGQSGYLKISPAQKQQIQQAVEARHNRTGEHWQSIYRKLHQFCRVNSYHEIAAAQFEAAMQFLAATPDTPARAEAAPAEGITFSEQQISRFGTAVYFLDWATHQLAELSIPLKMLGAREKGVAAHTLWSESQSWLKHCRAALQEAQAQMHDPYYRDHLAGSLQKMANLSA